MTANEKILSLIDCIPNCSGKEYESKIKELNLTVEDFSEFINFSKEKYVRNCVAKGNDFELILLAWEEGHKTAIHNHDGNEGWVYVLDGSFEEVRYNLNEGTEDLVLKSKTALQEKQICHTSKDALEYHSIRNSNSGRSLSLHLYKNPILKCNVYDKEANEMVVKKLAYDFKNEAIFLN